ncbi:MAG: tRNA pseudouridine(55) synthase TruB [Firmicutes bacterium]|nr:tRNA pseudouridine(55) synthase TruB [Bacillota bacterium]
MQNGIVVINKEKDCTSRDVVNQVCKIFNTKKVGHTGTLDPIATGVLVIGINDGTKVIELLTAVEKEYIAEVVVGIKTDTLDVTGNIIKKEKQTVEKEKIKEVLNSFLGKYNQEVPIYSAVRIDGKRLYEYARNNEKINLPQREVEIKNIELLDINNEGTAFSFKVTVSKGTYIRSLIRDIGNRLGVFCTMKNLTRTKQGIFSLEDSSKIEEIAINKKIIKIEDSLEYPRFYVDEEKEQEIKNGKVLPLNFTENYGLFFNKNNELIAIYQPYKENLMKPYKVFKI